MDQWRQWSAQKLPGRAVCRLVASWRPVRTAAPWCGLAAIEVHRTACIVTHPPAGETANAALVNPANERLAGTDFSAEECRRHLLGEAEYPRQVNRPCAARCAQQRPRAQHGPPHRL